MYCIFELPVRESLICKFHFNILNNLVTNVFFMSRIYTSSFATWSMKEVIVKTWRVHYFSYEISLVLFTMCISGSSCVKIFISFEIIVVRKSTGQCFTDVYVSLKIYVYKADNLVWSKTCMITCGVSSICCHEVAELVRNSYKFTHNNCTCILIAQSNIEAKSSRWHPGVT